MPQRNWLSKMLLLPCSKIYGAAMAVRNQMFEWNILKQTEFDVPIITVGNLAVGGTGKTPLVEHIAGYFYRTRRVAVVSRGYRRQTKGFVLAGKNTTPRDIGDESYQIYMKFGGRVTVAVCEDRVLCIRKLLEIEPSIDLIILDDAFQHRYVKPAVSILVSEYSRPYYQDKMLPYGRLRESAGGVYRADIVVVTKCPPNLKPIDYRDAKYYSKLQPWQQLFFSHFVYEPLKPVFDDVATAVPIMEWLTPDDSVLAVAGIGNPRPFVKHIKSFSAKVKVDIFQDHHQFTRRDLDHIHERYKSMKGVRRLIVTTEKDAVRLASNPYYPPELRAVTFYLPVSIDFEYPFSEPQFDSALEKTLRDALRRRNQ